ncbi:AI-2E family transporter [Candidatus Saccharibacteria bacterium]|nr:AI-2E family transporter [Candidatus Saccharibacteria bacterium]
MSNERNQWTKLIPVFVLALILIIVFKTLDNLSGIGAAIGHFFRVLFPFLFSIIIFYFLYRPCAYLEKLYSKAKLGFFKKRARFWGVLTVYLILVAALAFISTLIVPILVSSLIDFANNIPSYLDIIADALNHLFAENSLFANFDVHQAFGNWSSDYLLNSDNVEQLGRGVISVGTGIFNFVVSIIVSLYVLLEREKIAHFFDRLSRALFKDKTRDHLSKYLAQVNKVLFTFIASKGLDSLINFSVVTTILVVLDVQYALLFGIIAGLANFIPFLGSLFAVLFITLITLITGGPNQALWTLGFLLLFQQLDANFIEPRIMGYSLKISPILVIFAVIVGGAYFGIAGMFLAVPVVVILKQILLEYITLNLKKKES